MLRVKKQEVMKIRLPFFQFIIWTFLFCGGLLYIAPSTPAAGLEFTLGPVYSRGDFKWSIAGDRSGQNPDVLSELIWEDLQVYTVNSSLRIPVGRFHLEASLSGGAIGKGWVFDSDYHDSGRTGMFSQSVSESQGDESGEIRLGAGYRLLNQPRLNLTLSGGYYRSVRNLRIRDGFQIWPVPGPIEGLNTTYRTRWEGTWLGVDLSGKVWPWLEVFSEWKQEFGHYYGIGDWNLREDLAHPVSFIHQASGGGGTMTVGLKATMSCHWGMSVAYSLRERYTGAGNDRYFLADGGYGETAFNGAGWGEGFLKFVMSYR